MKNIIFMLIISTSCYSQETLSYADMEKLLNSARLRDDKLIVDNNDSCYLLIGVYSKQYVYTIPWISKEFPSKKLITEYITEREKTSDFMILSISVFTRKQWYNYIKK